MFQLTEDHDLIYQFGVQHNIEESCKTGGSHGGDAEEHYLWRK
jgi:hypothetical protein